MQTVNIAQLKDKLSSYLTLVKAGQEIVIRDRNLPVAKLIPFVSESASDEEMALVASGAMRLPETPFNIDDIWKMPKARVKSNSATQALLDEREESR